MSASTENGSFIHRAAIVSFTLRNRMAEDQLGFAEEAICPVPVISAGQVIHQTP